MQYTVLIEPADDGSLSVWMPDLPGCASCGDTPNESLANIVEAIKGYIETLCSHCEPVPPPRSVATVVLAA
jgi:predicted RNase H-like HicB family nuclease